VVCAGVELCTGDELDTDGELDTEELETDELFGVVFDVVVVLALGFLGGACRAGTAPAFVKGVMLAC
jgi:hypothetical protein